MNRPIWRFPAWLAMGALLACAGAAMGVPVVKMGVIGSPMIISNDVQIDVNNIAMFVTNRGGFARDLESPGGPSGLFFPRGTDKTAVYAAGLWFGSTVNGEVRVTVAEYDLEYTPGLIYNNGGTITFDDAGDARLKVYKLAKGDTLSEDYLNWPVADGAPLTAEGKPLWQGDQTCWAVYNDADASTHTNDAGGSSPQNIEIRQTTFAFDRQGPLGNMIFVKFNIKNKGNDTLEDAFVSMWSDVDMGGATDDMAGCDTLLSLGYVYNAANTDEIYGGVPPAVGFDFFQGPIVPGEPSDTALVSGQRVPGYKNLPMTSYNRYINGTDPDTKNASYNYMKGLTKDGSPLHLNDDPLQPITRYFFSGDPVTETGWLDPAQADKRIMLSSGPFTMAPGDSQEVVVGLIVAQGGDRLSSITLLKSYDDQAQKVFDANFDLPSAPPRPVLYARPMDGAIDLSWSTDAVGDIQISAPLNEEYHHEGYNLYQGESIAGPWKKIATWDVANDVGYTYADVFDASLGGNERVITQQGTNNGLEFHMLLTDDKILGGPLHNAFDYYYAVSAYSYDVNHVEPYVVGANQVGVLSPTLENSKAGVTVRPRSSSAVLDSSGERLSGTSDGSVKVAFVQPELVQNGTFDVTFREKSIDGTPTIVWDLTNATTHDTLLAAQTYQSSNPEDYAYPVVDGMMVRVLGPAPGFKHDARPGLMFDEIIAGDGAGGGTPVPPDGNGGPGRACFWNRNSTGEWSLACGGGDGGEGRLTRDGTTSVNLTSSDIIMKWDYAEDNWAVWGFDSGMTGKVPFGLYLKDPVTGAETRLVPELTAGGGTEGIYEIQQDTVDGHYGLPCTDWCYGYTFDGNWEAFVADVSDGEYTNDTTNLELFARLVVVQRGAEPVLPANGTVIQFSTTKPNTPADKFQFKAYAPGEAAGTVIGNDLNSIRVVPNPYLNQSAYELNQFDRVIKFVNLPAKPATIRIFNLGGDLVQTIEKTSLTNGEVIWNLQNSQSIPVASGIYLYTVDVKGLGRKTGKMAVFVEKERLNRF
jgi:hypothetical protein